MLCEITIPGTLLMKKKLTTIINHTSKGLAMSQGRFLAETVSNNVTDDTALRKLFKMLKKD